MYHLATIALFHVLSNTKVNLYCTSTIRFSGGLVQWVFEGSSTFFANLPNSILSGVDCQPKTGSKRKREGIKRTMTQWVWETASQKHNGPALISRARVPQPSLTVHLKASKHDGKIPASTAGKCVSDQTLFSLQMPFNSLGPKIDYWKKLILSVSA